MESKKEEIERRKAFLRINKYKILSRYKESTRKKQKISNEDLKNMIDQKCDLLSNDEIIKNVGINENI